MEKRNKLGGSADQPVPAAPPDAVSDCVFGTRVKRSRRTAHFSTSPPSSSSSFSSSSFPIFARERERQLLDLLGRPAGLFVCLSVGLLVCLFFFSLRKRNESSLQPVPETLRGGRYIRNASFQVRRR